VIDPRHRERYALRVLPTAQRALAERLPERVAFAVLEFINGPLLDNPRRLSKTLHNELAGAYAAYRKDYRVVYEIDDDARTVTVLNVNHRSHILLLPLNSTPVSRSGCTSI